MTENNPTLIFSIFRCRRELIISGFVEDTDNDKISIICNDVQKEEERQCLFSAMGNGPFDCESDCTVTVLWTISRALLMNIMRTLDPFLLP